MRNPLNVGKSSVFKNFQLIRRWTTEDTDGVWENQNEDYWQHWLHEDITNQQFPEWTGQSDALRTEASPLELRAEARYEAEAQLTASQQAHADASLQAQKQRDQYAGYKPLPAHIDRNALIKASKDELRRWSRLYGQFQLNTALRGQQ